MIKIISAIFLVTIVGCDSNSYDANDEASVRALDMDLASLIEASVSLPDDHQVSEYVRFYADVEKEGVRFVKAVYLDNRLVERHGARDGGLAINYPGEGQIRIVQENQFPLITDGGCSIVNILYDVSRAEFEHVYCNGRA